MQKWVLLCLILELLSELRMSEKFNQHFTFLTGLIISAVFLGSVLSKIGTDSSFFQVNLQNELQKWQEYSQNYELNDNLQKKLAKVEEAYEVKTREEGISIMQEKFEDILADGKYEITFISYDEKKDLLFLKLRKQENCDKREIKVEKIGNEAKEEEQLLQEKVSQRLTEKLREEGEHCGLEVTFE